MCPVVSLPFSVVDPVTEILHGIPVTDPYRWLEDQNSAETRAWIKEQTRYARGYLDSIPRREAIRKRVRELLDVETYDSFIKGRTTYFFRKRLPGQEQPCIYFRKGIQGTDQLLINPAERGGGNYTAVKPLCVSQDDRLLLFQVKQGGERTGTFEILDVGNRTTLADFLPRGYLRGFAFTPSGNSFYYVHEATKAKRPFYRAVYHHILGTSFDQDREVYSSGEDQKLRMAMVSGRRQLGFLSYRFLEKIYTSFEILGMGSTRPPVPILRNAEYMFAPAFLGGRILALTDKDAPNRRIVEVQPTKQCEPLFFDLVPETEDVIQDWIITANNILVSYTRGPRTWVEIVDSFGERLGQIPCADGETPRLVAGGTQDDDILLEYQSFTKPTQFFHYSIPSGTSTFWAQTAVPFDPIPYTHTQVSFPSRDGVNIPMFLLGKRDLAAENHPLVMTAYGGYGIPMTPQFSVLVAFLIEHGCLFALPNIRGGSEFGIGWHHAAKRRNRQTAFHDFLSAAEWLLGTNRTTPKKLAIFGGSNSGLLVGAAMTQRPDLFRAVLCLAPLLDMLRYHLFDNSHVWKDEFGTAEDPDDFEALADYSPYHAVRDGFLYPATMIVSGDADQNCNGLHARKMAARLQAANASESPIFLDYSPQRGHSPVLPLSARVDALTDRLAFLCDQLQLTV